MNFSNTVGLVEMLRMIKDKEEIDAFTKAANLTDKTFDFIQTKIKKGGSEKELAFEIEFFIKKNGADLAFDPIVAIDEDAAIPHHMSNSTKKITGNNLLLLDFGAKVNNYCSDMTRVVFIGTPEEKKKKVYDTVLSSQTAALKALKAGANGMEIDKIARDVIEKEGFESYSHGLGHGVGLEIHEAPRLRARSTEILDKNAVVTVEPGIYIPGFCGVRIEDLVVLKENGVEILSNSNKDLIIL
jgi:Xaa-Pro aminopeptidase